MILHARSTEQILWTRGTNEGINLVASSWGRSQLKEGDRVLVSAMEHHSNIVPWQMVAEATGARGEASPVDGAGTLDMAALKNTLDERRNVMSDGHVCTAHGPVQQIQDVSAVAPQAE